MKTPQSFAIIPNLVLLLAFLTIQASTLFAQSPGQFKIRNDAWIQIGYDAYKLLSFGDNQTLPNNGVWAIEHWDNGLNIYRPWPANAYKNYYLFISDSHNPGDVGINGRPWSGQKLQVNGTIGHLGSGPLSDERLKANIRVPEEELIDKFMQIQVVRYDYQQDKINGLSFPTYSRIQLEAMGFDETTIAYKLQMQQAELPHQSNMTNRIGVLAQQLEQHFPELVITANNGYKSVLDSDMIPMLIAIVQQQQIRIDYLEQSIEELKK